MRDIRKFAGCLASSLCEMTIYKRKNLLSVFKLKTGDKIIQL